MINKLVVFIGRSIAFLLTIALCIPVVLLPNETSVPVNIWLPLAAADLGLIVIFFHIKPIVKGTAISLAGVCAIALIAVLSTHAYSQTISISNPKNSIIHTSVSYIQEMVLASNAQ